MYILDTDHLSLIQRNGQDRDRVYRCILLLAIVMIFGLYFNLGWGDVRASEWDIRSMILISIELCSGLR